MASRSFGLTRREVRAATAQQLLAHVEDSFTGDDIPIGIPDVLERLCQLAIEQAETNADQEKRLARLESIFGQMEDTE